jgi:outer membrane protein OmpA-like peptidoglycan-associated protein
MTVHPPAPAPAPPQTIVHPSAPAPAPPVASATPAVSAPAAPAPPAPARVPGKVFADRSPVDAATRKAIVDRIALAPDIPTDKKEKVREIVSRAREMRRVLVLPFASGQSELGATDVAALRDLMRAPDFTTYRDDPTYAFIVLGFADARGADDMNLRLSTDRARHVRDLLRRDSSLPNIIHPVGLGKTTLLDDQQLEKNRIVEVWVIQL